VAYDESKLMNRGATTGIGAPNGPKLVQKEEDLMNLEVYTDLPRQFTGANHQRTQDHVTYCLNQKNNNTKKPDSAVSGLWHRIRELSLTNF
jgi:hypothetical protein